MDSMDKNAISKILENIREEKGLDFTQYKEKSVERRIHSRMRINEIETYFDYINFLKKTPDEYNKLISALTINVTEFFRNPESFEIIKNVVIPRVIYAKRKLHHRVIKVVSCGCSTGDEPYSMAILLLEKLGMASKNFTLNILGLDIDRDAIDKSKKVEYSALRFKAIKKDLIEKYFDKIDDEKYVLKEVIKKMVNFKFNDIINDPLTRHCDIILCRNLLIYFNKQLQEEILLKLYESLSPGGFLILGMTETLVGSAIDSFELINNRLRIYKRPENYHSSQENGLLAQNDIDNIVKDMLR